MKRKAFNSLCAAVMTAVMVLSLPLPVMAAADDLLLSDAAAFEQAEELPELTAAPDDRLADPEAESYDTSDAEDVLETQDLSEDTIINGIEHTASENEAERPPSFNEDNIVIEPPTADVYYTGEALEPAFTLKKKNGGEVIPATEYTVTYEDNVNPGWGFVTFTSNKVSYEEGEIYDFFLIKYDMTAVKGLNTAVSLTSLSGNILVKNTNGAKDLDIYAYTVATNDIPSIKAKYSALEGTRVEKGKSAKMSTAYEFIGGDARKRTLDPAKEYTVFASPDPLLLLLDDSEDYTELAKVKITPASSGGADGYKNGADISLSAVTQKSQDIKLSWKPDKKTFPEQGDYAAFALYTLKNDGTETKFWPAGSAVSAKGKSCTVKAADAEALKSNVIMLKCFDKEGILKDKFLTVTAPYLCAVQGGSMDGELDFRFSALSQASELSFVMQGAQGANKEANYTADLTCNVPSEGLEQVVYPLSSKVNLSALKADYYVSPDKLAKDNKYFFRVKASYNFNGMAVTSAPSNAIGMNIGPNKSEILLITGEDPKELMKNLDTSSPNAFNGIHADSDSTCFKKGYVVFHSPIAANDASVTGRVELLRCNTRNGMYKVAKKYKPAQAVKLDTSAIIKDFTDPETIAFYSSLYYVEFNNFPPEEQWFYQVRVVSKKGAVGGAGEAYENMTRFEKVQNLIVMDTGSNTVEMYWKHDDCAKQYWIYRYENEDPHNTVDYMAKLREAAASKPLYTVSGTKFSKGKDDDGSIMRYHSFTDKNVKNGHEYYYMVRPVYNTKTTATYDQFEYATSVYTDIDESGIYKKKGDPMGVIPTALAEAPKSVKTESYNMLYPVIRWTSVKDTKANKVVGYRIERTTKPESETSTWTKVVDVIKGSPDKVIKNAFTKREFRDETVEALGPYEYRVCALFDVNAPKEGPDGKSGYTYARFDTKPLPVSSFTSGKQSGHNYRYGANLRFTIDKKDMALLQEKSGVVNLYYTLECSDTGKDWDWYTLTPKTPVNPYQATYTYRDDDELRRGVNRRYRVTLTNGATDETGLPDHAYKSERTVNYKKPTDISLEGHGDVMEGSGSFNLKIDYNGSVRELDGAPTTSNSDVLSIEEWDNEHVKVCPKRPGTATITVRAYQCGWGGGSLTKSVTIKVNPKQVNVKP